MFFKMTLDRVWPSRFGDLRSTGLPLAPQKPAAAAPATNAPAALMPTGLRKVAPINANGLSVKVAKGEAKIIVTEAVLSNMELLSNVIKYALESNAQAPMLASVAQGWQEQLCFWKQQLQLKTALCKELKAGVQCLDCSPLGLLHGWGASPRNLLLGLPLPVIADTAAWEDFRALGESYGDRVITRADVLTLLDLPGGGNGWLTGGLIDGYMGSFLHDVRRTRLTRSQPSHPRRAGAPRRPGRPAPVAVRAPQHPARRTCFVRSWLPSRGSSSEVPAQPLEFHSLQGSPIEALRRAVDDEPRASRAARLRPRICDRSGWHPPALDHIRIAQHTFGEVTNTEGKL